MELTAYGMILDEKSRIERDEYSAITAG